MLTYEILGSFFMVGHMLGIERRLLMVTKGYQPFQYSTQDKKPKSQKQVVKEKAATVL